MSRRTGIATNTGGSVEKRLGREDWIKAAWDILGKGNLDDIKVKVLAEELGVTRGSFYWHFKNRQALIDALLDRWFAILGFGQAVEPTVDPIENPKEQLWAVFHLVITKIDAGQSVALRLFSKHNLKLRRRIEAEDRRRLGHFAGIFERMGYSHDLAVDQARVYHAVVMSEYLRNGALTLADRLADAQRMHTTLTAGDPR